MPSYPKTVAVSSNIVRRRMLQFSSPKLAGWSWPVHEIVGCRPGPRLCVMAGIHVNEVSSIEAAIRLQNLFAHTELWGTVCVMPVVNLPGLPVHAEFVCPVDGKNINFSFPGSPDGSFSEALADAILNEWADDAECLVDMHGGDLCEMVARFTVVATTGNDGFDARNEAFARAFDPQIVVRLDKTTLEQPGRSCSGRARLRRHAAFAEGGGNGLLDEDSITFHANGVLRIAGLLGMIKDPPPLSGRKPRVVENYHWVSAEVAGWCRFRVDPGQQVAAGDVLAEIDDYSGEVVKTIVSPADGVMLWRCTHPVVAADTALCGIGA